MPETPDLPVIPEETRWSVRGEPRTRAIFADSHPDDFPGSLSVPADYPDISAPITGTI